MSNRIYKFHCESGCLIAKITEGSSAITWKVQGKITPDEYKAVTGMALRCLREDPDKDNFYVNELPVYKEKGNSIVLAGMVKEPLDDR